MKLGQQIRLARNELDFLERTIGQELGFPPLCLADLRLLLHIVRANSPLGTAPHNKAVLQKLHQFAEFAEDQKIAGLFQ